MIIFEIVFTAINFGSALYVPFVKILRLIAVLLVLMMHKIVFLIEWQFSSGAILPSSPPTFHYKKHLTISGGMFFFCLFVRNYGVAYYMDNHKNQDKKLIVGILWLGSCPVNIVGVLAPSLLPLPSRDR